MASAASGTSSRTLLTMAETSCGSEPPLVSHRTTVSAPASEAARTHWSAYSGFALNPSKKCSASSSTVFSCRLKNATLSAIIARFSSRFVSRICVTCMSQVLPTMVTTGVLALSACLSVASVSAEPLARRVLQNAASLACFSSSDCARWKNSASLGLAPGQPPSMKSMPSSSSFRAILSLSSTERETPSCCVPSRNVVS